MGYGHKFAKLKLTNHQNLAIYQNLLPPKFPAVQYFLPVYSSVDVVVLDIIRGNIVVCSIGLYTTSC